MSEKKDSRDSGAEVFSPEEEQRRRRERRKKLFSTLAKVVTGFVVVSFTATEAMMFILFGRTDPPLDKPFGVLSWAAGKGYRAHTADFMSGENRLKGFVIVPEAPSALMLIVHGVRSSSDALEPVVRYFTERNYAVMTFDGTASGRSEGSKTVGLQQQRYDIRAALSWIRQDPEIRGLPLVMLGHSAGAYGVAMETEDSGAAASACVSGFETPLGTMRFWAEHYTGPLSSVEYPFLWIREYAAKGLEANESGAAAVLGCGVPVLVVQGEKDEVVSTEISLYQSVRRRQGSGVNTLLITDPRFSHHSDILVSGETLNLDLLRTLEAFFARGLSRGGGR